MMKDTESKPVPRNGELRLSVARIEQRIGELASEVAVRAGASQDGGERPVRISAAELVRLMAPFVSLN